MCRINTRAICFETIMNNACRKWVVFRMFDEQAVNPTSTNNLDIHHYEQHMQHKCTHFLYLITGFISIPTAQKFLNVFIA